MTNFLQCLSVASVVFVTACGGTSESTKQEMDDAVGGENAGSGGTTPQAGGTSAGSSNTDGGRAGGGASGGFPGTCENAIACGGDIVGTWQVTSTCIDADVTPSMGSMNKCTVSFSTNSLQYQGSISYRADLTYDLDVTVRGAIGITLPAECLTQKDVTLTCAQVEARLKADPDNKRFSSISCESAGTGCTCDLDITGQRNTESGTYTTTAAGLVSTTPSSGSGETNAYCVKGSTLTLSPSGNSTGGTARASGRITLTKQ